MAVEAGARGTSWATRTSLEVDQPSRQPWSVRAAIGGDPDEIEKKRRGRAAPELCAVELDEDAERLFRLIESLEEDDDVGAVDSNLYISDELLERVAD